MALAELVSRLERDAEGRLGALRERTRAEVTALQAEATQAREAQRDEELGRRRAERQGHLGRQLAELRQRVRADRLRAEHDLLDRVFARALALSAEQGATLAVATALPAWLEEALRFVEPRGAVVRCSPALAAAVAPVLDLHREVVLELDAALPPGVVVSAADGSVFVDQTLPARLARSQPRLRIELLAAVAP